MRRSIALACAAALLAAGCGGGAHERRTARPPAPRPVRVPPVADQLRDALNTPPPAARPPALPAQLPSRVPLPRLPFVSVRRCTGPGGAGTYHCATVPRGATGVRAIEVDVRPDGSFTSTAPVRDSRTASHSGPTRVYGAANAGVAVLGFGLTLPR